MLAYAVDLLNRSLPTFVADHLPTVTCSSANNSSAMETTLPPLTPFCCVSALPSSFRYLAELLPASTTHNVLAKPLTSTPLITAFLMYVTNCYHNPHAPQAKEIIRPSATNLYYAIVQLTVIKSAVPTPIAAPLVTTTKSESSSSSSSSKLPRLAQHPMPRTTVASIYKFAPIEEDFTDIVLTPLPSTSSQYVHIQPPPPPPKIRETKYFVPIENSRESTILNDSQKLKGGKAWKEIAEGDAMESLRFPGTGIGIGDGENWRALQGVEKVVCMGHEMEFEIRAWVKEL